MRSLAGSLADGVLADAILIPPLPPILTTNIRKVSGPQKKYRHTLYNNHLLVNEKMRCRMAKRFSKQNGSKG